MSFIPVGDWQTGWPDKVFQYYEAKVKHKGVTVLYFYRCKQSGKFKWYDRDWNEVKEQNVVSWRKQEWVDDE